MSLSASAGMMQNGQSFASLRLNIASQRQTEEKSQAGEEESGNIAIAGPQGPSSNCFCASKGELLQDALLSNFQSKRKNMVSNLFVSLLPDTSEYLQAHLDGLRMQNEFAAKLNGVLETAIMNSRAGESTAFIERTIEESIKQTGDGKIHEDAEEDFKEAEEELDEEIEEKVSGEEDGDPAPAEGADAVRQDIELKAEEATQPESQAKAEPAAEALTVAEAIDKESERGSHADKGSAVSTETALQAADGGAAEADRAMDSAQASAVGASVNLFV